MEEFPLTIRTVSGEDAADLASVRTLWKEYAAHLEIVLGPEHLCMSGFEAELHRLPNEYTGSLGSLLLAEYQGTPAGCTGVRIIRLADHSRVCELRRMWVRPEFRSRGVGGALLKSALRETANLGCNYLYLDTVPEKMQTAVQLYQAAGFTECSRYNRNSVPGIAFFRRKLSDNA